MCLMLFLLSESRGLARLIRLRFNQLISEVPVLFESAKKMALAQPTKLRKFERSPNARSLALYKEQQPVVGKPVGQ